MKKQFQSRLLFITAAMVLSIAFMPVSLADLQSIVVSFDGRIDSSGLSSPWKLQEKEGRAEVKVISDGGEKVVYLKSDCASFSIEREVQVNIRNYQYLTWKWKAMKLPPMGDLRSRKTNDQALQLLIAFESRKVLSYIWDSNAPEGTVGDESLSWPISLQVKVLTIKSGTADTGKWLTVTRNVYDDYKRIFGDEPPPVKGVRIQINSQHTESVGEGYFGKIVFARGAAISKKQK